MSTQEIGYADALSELQQILGELEAEDIDIDVLAVKVERAAELIRVCRGRINDAEVRVKEIVAGLDHEEDEPSPNEED
ncbi:MAG: exodeoxyribonuclease VII small subunit [Acidimicrobiia bacterium]|nr:exodeoxyribonuclease VII small subunit [Acidimicrobiia bacterium]MYE73290.1 exodeoxyribonuclease VII small subunit [Acidimicrobiia bacterium]MYJ63030.1 exodeoxyribonuclease VII small subunit [Acidimicrobiia bacterium]